MENTQRYLDAVAIQQITGLGRSAVYNLLHAEGCPSLKLGRRVIVRADLFDAWLSETFQAKSGAKYEQHF